MKKLFEDDNEDLKYLHAIRKVIKNEQDRMKKDLMQYEFTKMVRENSPYNIIYKEMKNVQKHDLRELAEKANRINNAQKREYLRSNEEELEDYDDEKPEDILKVINDPELKRFALDLLRRMKLDDAPVQAQIDFMKDVRDRISPYLPENLRKKVNKKIDKAIKKESRPTHRESIENSDTLVEDNESDEYYYYAIRKIIKKEQDQQKKKELIHKFRSMNKKNIPFDVIYKEIKKESKVGEPKIIEKVSPKEATKSILKKIPGYTDKPTKCDFDSKVNEYLKANKKQ